MSTPFDANPFADSNPWGEPVAPTAPQTAAPQEAPMTNPVDSEAFTATLKFGGGYDAPWLVLRGADAATVKAQIEDARTSGLLQLMGQAAAYVATLAPQKPGANSAPKQFVGGQVVETATGAPVAQAAPAAPAAGGFTCAHGQRTYKEGPGWAAYFCPQPKGAPDQCAPMWRDKKTGQFK